MKNRIRKIISSADKEEKTFNRNKWIFSMGGIGRDMLCTLVSSYFFMYVQFGLTLSVSQFAALSLIIGVLGRIWDGINDPLMGTIIDGSSFKWGKFKPWIFLGSILSGIFLLILFNLRPFGSEEIYGWIYIGIISLIYFLWEASFTMNDIGYWGAITSLSPSEKKRNKLTTLVILFAGIGSSITTFVIGVLSPGKILTAFTIYSIVACTMMILCQTIVCFTVKEGKKEEEEIKEKASLKKTFKIIFNNKQLLWISLGFLLYDFGNGILYALIYNLYYLEYGYDGSFAITIILIGIFIVVFQILYPKLSKIWGRKKTQKIAFILMSIGYIWIALIGWFKFLPFNPITLAIGYSFVGVGGMYFYITTLINFTNCVEYNQYLTGERNEAVITSARPLVAKFSGASKSLFTTMVLVISGLFALSQQVSNLETQKNLINNNIIKDNSATSLDNLKYYITKLNEYGVILESIEDEELLDLKIQEIQEQIDSDDNQVLKVARTDANFINTYREMYILKKQDKKIVAYSKIKDLVNLDSYFNTNYSYEASFVFQFTNEDNRIIKVNVANEVYDTHSTLSTRIILRIMVTLVPISILLVSYYIQSKKFIIDENFYHQMMEEIKQRKHENQSTCDK